jgi:predicted pyridoxine 5'-phosphate oxidase superfamily flavin-nucleotide-binding protein
MDGLISTVDELEQCVGAAGLPIKMKIIDHIDETAAKWIAASPIAFVGLSGADRPSIAAAGGRAGFAGVPDSGGLSIPLPLLDSVSLVETGQWAGTLFLVPGIGETLRVNGRVRAVNDGRMEIAVEECFVHCAKALIRSDFWNASVVEAPAGERQFLDATRFMALATMDKDGRVDVSPKGDKAGLLLRAEGEEVTLAERPGNRLAFGYRNIIEQPRVAALAVVPGAAKTVTLRGEARLSSDENLRSVFAVDGKMPILATVIGDIGLAMHASEALRRAALWDAPPRDPDIDPAATLVAHVKLNKARGAQATMLRMAVSRGVVAKGLESNYKTDLY